MDRILKDLMQNRGGAAPENRGGAAPPNRGAAIPGAMGRATSLIPPLPDVCRRVIDMIPYSLRGEERLQYMANKMREQSDKEQAMLQVHIEQLVRRMIDVGASDIEVGGASTNGYVWYRVDGDKRPDQAMGHYTVEQTDLLLLNLVSDQQRETLFRRRAVDFSYQVTVKGHDGQPRRFRATCYFDLDHLALNMRMITDELRSMKALGFHPLVQNGLMFSHIRDGLTLITGVTGSGKSTTLDAIVDENNKDCHGHIVIIGNPVEFMHQSKKCIVRHREVGRDVPSFKDGIVQALRQDPDIVVIGEMRDPLTISAALEITDSGHKVFSTLHTSSAVESIDRIIAEYPHDEQERVRNRLADVLRCVVSQKLCPRVGGGRVLAKEVLWMTPSAQAAIKNENTSEIYQMMWEGWSKGMITLEQDLFRLVRQGLITHETAMNYANNKRRLQRLVN